VCCNHHTPQVKTEGGKIIRVEAHPIPEHPRPRRCKGRVALVGDAAGYVTKCSGEGIYFAAKSGRMAAEAIVEASQVSGPGAGYIQVVRMACAAKGGVTCQQNTSWHVHSTRHVHLTWHVHARRWVNHWRAT
jgi:2-polyprenyl-6-methoxyphenol hydroxylase-like FAD-dependent oxidoreductase